MKEPCNIIASQDCTITEIVTASGTPVVKAGDDVKKGDILISGAVYLYDDNNEVLDTNYVSAEGTVYGICVYHYKDTVPLSCYSKEYTGNEKELLFLWCISVQPYPLMYQNALSKHMICSVIRAGFI